MRRPWQAPVAAVPHHLLCGQLDQEHPKTKQVSRQGAPCAHQHLWCRIQAAAAHGCARCTPQHLGEAQVSQAGPVVVRQQHVAAGKEGQQMGCLQDALPNQLQGKRRWRLSSAATSRVGSLLQAAHLAFKSLCMTPRSVCM